MSRMECVAATGMHSAFDLVVMQAVGVHVLDRRRLPSGLRSASEADTKNFCPKDAIRPLSSISRGPGSRPQL